MSRLLFANVLRRRTNHANTRHIALIGGIAAAFLVSAVLIGGLVRSDLTVVEEQGFEGSWNNLVPFLSNLTEVPHLASRSETKFLRYDDLQGVQFVPYAAAAEMCHMREVGVFRGGKRVILVTSGASAKSAWQAKMVSYLLKSRDESVSTVKARKPEELILAERLSGTSKRYGLRHFIFHSTRLLRPLVAVDPLRMSGLSIEVFSPTQDLYLKDACPCCIAVKELIGLRAPEQAMIYMHGLALGLNPDEELVSTVREKLAVWVKKEFCHEKSLFTMFCRVLAEYDHLIDSDALRTTVNEALNWRPIQGSAVEYESEDDDAEEEEDNTVEEEE